MGTMTSSCWADDTNEPSKPESNPWSYFVAVSDMKKILKRVQSTDEKLLNNDITNYRKLISKITKQVVASKSSRNRRPIEESTLKRNKLCVKTFRAKTPAKEDPVTAICATFLKGGDAKAASSTVVTVRNANVRLHTKNNVKFWMSSILAKLNKNTDYLMLRKHIDTCRKLSKKFRGVITYDELVFSYLQTMYTKNGIQTQTISSLADDDDSDDDRGGKKYNNHNITTYFAEPITPMHHLRLQYLQSIMGELFFCYHTLKLLIGPMVMRRCAFKKKYEEMWKTIKSEVESFSFSGSETYIEKSDDSMKEKLAPSRAVFASTMCVLSRIIDAMWANTKRS